jgi:cell division initiation protein
VTPESIRIRTFKTGKKNGYDPAEVQEFLEALATEIEELHAELANNKSAYAEQRHEVTNLKAQHAKPDESKLQVDAVLQELKKTSDELVEHSKINAAAIAMRTEQDRKMLFDQAKTEAEIIIRDAEKKAQAIADTSQAKVQEYRDEIGILQARRLAIISRVKSLLVSQQQFLESLEQDALGQTRELTDIVKESGTKAGLSAEQLDTILRKLEEHQGTA